MLGYGANFELTVPPHGTYLMESHGQSLYISSRCSTICMLSQNIPDYQVRFHYADVTGSDKTRL